MVGSQETELLGTPETKANSVLNAELGQSLSNLQDTNDTRTIVAEIWLVNVTRGCSRDTYLIPGPAATESE